MHTRAPMPFGAHGGDRPAPHYRAFISYSHADTRWANWLLRRLEGYRVPTRFHGTLAPLGRVGPRIAPVFRDRDELPTTSDLGETIRAALRESATLVVICSPASARSRWVREEILAFKRLHGEARVFAFIVGGEPKAVGTAEDCFSPALRFSIGADGELSSTPAEHVAADARPEGDGKDDAFLRLVAGLLGVGFDELRQRELQRRHRRMTLVVAASTLGMAITLGLAAVAWQARNDARRRQEQGEDLLAFMLGDLRSQLEKVGRLDVLEAVGDKSMAYFAALDPRDLNDTSLARRATALRQIGEIRMAQTRYPEATRAFATAYESSALLAARYPQNGDMLFERGQAEFWIGFVHWRRGDFGPAREWLTRYRDTGVALVALDPARPQWRSELAWGWHNMAVLNVEDGHFEAARAEFLAEWKVLEVLTGTSLDNNRLQFRFADVVSYLGTLEERSGRLAAALEQFRDYTRRTEELVRSEPLTLRWQERLANAHAMEANVLEITGERPAARQRRQEARRLLEGVTAKDPKNRIWAGALLKARLREVQIDATEISGIAAAGVLTATVDGLERLHRAEPTDRVIASLLALGLRLDAQRLHANRDGGAADAIGRALGICQDLVARQPANEEQLGEYAWACVVAGQISEQRGEAELALQHWQRGLDALRGRLRDSAHWRLLDPATRLLALLGRESEQRDLVGRLERIGYQLFEPWPAASAAASLAATVRPLN